MLTELKAKMGLLPESTEGGVRAALPEAQESSKVDEELEALKAQFAAQPLEAEGSGQARKDSAGS